MHCFPENHSPIDIDYWAEFTENKHEFVPSACILREDMQIINEDSVKIPLIRKNILPAGHIWFVEGFMVGSTQKSNNNQYLSTLITQEVEND